jgi:hypothetical protein
MNISRLKHGWKLSAIFNRIKYKSPNMAGWDYDEMVDSNEQK